jgi:PPOX class probable F420-dependent enzyme
VSENLNGRFDHLDGHQFMNLVTYRRNGQAVTTTVWFACEGERLVVWTGADSGKVKRIRNNGRVEVGPSTAQGKSLGEIRAGTARILPEEEQAKAVQALKKKYGLQFQAFASMGKLRRQEAVCLEIVPQN